MRDKNHYLKLLEQNPDTAVGVSLAAAAVYAARFGSCEAGIYASEKWKQIARRLRSKYGETLTPNQVRAEMEKPSKN